MNITNPEAPTLEQLKSMLDLNIRKYDEQRENLASTEEPLTVAELTRVGLEERIHDEQFLNVLSRVGWPDNSDAHIDWSISFPTGSDGDSKAMKLFIGSDEGADLSNFRAYFKYPPTFEVENGASIIKTVYATYPAVHRLEVVDPELFRVLHAVIDAEPVGPHSLAEFFGKFDTTQENSEIYNPVAHLLRQAYMIMGRLVKPNDIFTYYKMQGWPIDSSHHEYKDTDEALRH